MSLSEFSRQSKILLFVFTIVLMFSCGNSSSISTHKIINFKKTPYLIYTGNNRNMKIMWQFYKKDKCTLKWGCDSLHQDRSVKLNEQNKDHLFSYLLSGLLPNKKYYYQIEIYDAKFTGTFISAPGQESSNITFFVYGDTQYGTKVHDQIAANILNFTQNNCSSPTFVLHTGDITDDGSKESYWDRELFHKYYTNIRKLFSSVPFQACLGNHDMDYYCNSTMFAKYFPYPYINGRYWSFDYGPAHFFVFDIYSRYSGREGYEIFFFEQLEYLKNDLSSSNKEWKFIVLHDPGWTADKEYNWRVREYLQPVCTKYKVDIVFAGNHHIYSHAIVDGVHHITTGGGGRLRLNKPLIKSDNIVTAKSILHYCQTTIIGKKLLLSARGLDGDTIDTFEISH